MSDQVKGLSGLLVPDERSPSIYSLRNTEQRPRNSITGGESHGPGLCH